MGRIAAGKGLGAVADRCAAAVRPTPAAVFDLVAGLDRQPGWQQTLLIDLGGATTDLYSITPPADGEAGVVLKGLPEPPVKRSVEGDLGMRVNAVSAASAEPGLTDRALAEDGLVADDFERYVRGCAEAPGRLPAGGAERAYDRRLAEACIRQALIRHAGRRREVHTAAGRVQVQRGKDLRGVRRVVASGGYLAESRDPQVVRRALAGAWGEGGGERLLPRAADIVFDTQYALPAAAALGAHDGAAAAAFFTRIVQPSMHEVCA